MAQALKWLAVLLAVVATVVIVALIGARMRHAGTHGLRWAAAPTTQQQLSLQAFDAIRLNSAAEMDITVGAPQSVSVEADQETLQRLQTTVQDHTLLIDSITHGHHVDFWFGRPQRSLRFTITIPALRAVSVQGAGRFDVHHVQGDTLSFDIAGAGDVNADGNIGALKLRIDGAGRVDASALDAASVDVDINGAGSASVRAHEALSAKVDGFGHIEYYGNPHSVAKQVSGLGSIRPAGSG